MSDLAIEAADRSLADIPAWDIEAYDWERIAVSAAREALAPIRELHKPGTDAGFEDEPYCETCGHYDGLSADFIHQPWPCGTARLIYTTEELLAQFGVNLPEGPTDD